MVKAELASNHALVTQNAKCCVPCVCTRHSQVDVDAGCLLCHLGISVQISSQPNNNDKAGVKLGTMSMLSCHAASRILYVTSLGTL